MGYDTMEAGRELDTLVAEKVMGWELRFDPNGELERKLPSIIPTPVECWVALPRLSLDISAAWEVVEKMRAENFATRLSIDQTPWVDCAIGGDLWEEGKHRTYAGAPTAPLAICRAALKAVMGES